MNVKIGTEAPLFLSWEYLFQIFGILSLQCRIRMVPTVTYGTVQFAPPQGAEKYNVYKV
jgi:hypothetical protein